MNDLQRLFKMRGTTMHQLSAAIGEGYHPTQKNVKGVRRTRHIQAAIASYLGLTVEEAFGPRSSRHLKPLIACEINKARAAYTKKLKTQYLAPTIAGDQKAVNG